MHSTPAHIIERNRLNALQSTGPRTERGKSISRRNATRHGLCANPADGVVEDPRAFEQLHHALVQRFCPDDAIEAELVHRIAVCLWRLQRAARIDGAIAGLQTEAIRPARERIHAWMTKITQEFAAVEWVEVTDPELLRRREILKPETKGQRWFRAERRFLERADRYRDETLMADGIAIQAMIYLLRELADQLEHAGFLEPTQAQMLAWLLGESAERLIEAEEAEDRSARFFPDERPYTSTIDDLIGQARKRPCDHEMPDALVTVIQSRLTDLETRSRTAQTPYTTEHEERLKTAALLPEAGVLDRLLRYEVHAEKGMIRALETLSRLRGVTIESIRATMTRPVHGEASFEIHGERTIWSGS